MGLSCRNSVAGLLTMLGLSALAGCVDEQIIYRDRDLFEEPLAQAGSFLGYSDQAAQLTVCGNCHVSPQSDWEETAHAHAWEEQASHPSTDDSCATCHSVTEYGNTVSETAGFNATFEERYHDVQCESCHGPGLEHVSDPRDATIPLAPIDVGDDLSIGCVQCHAGGPEGHKTYAEEWNLSRHGEGANRPQYRNRDGCNACHGGEGALDAWGIRTEFLEKGQDQPIAITCAVCHDPHSEDNEGQLRFSMSAPDVDQNLCMKCHQRRAIPDLEDSPGGSRGPHSPQGPLLLGEIGTVGWTPPDFPYDATRIRGTHGSERNANLCAGCHVYSAPDTASTEGVALPTGHLFKPIPCLDAEGNPTADDSCAKDEESRSWASCASSQCHGDETAAVSAYTLAQTRIADLVTELDALLEQVVANDSTQIDRDDTVFTVAEGAEFNMKLGEISSSAIHNPFLTEALLTSSIAAVRDRYNLPAATNVVLGTIWPQFTPDTD